MEIEDFVDNTDYSDLFDCEFSSLDAIINKVTVFTGVDTNRETENGARTLVAYGMGYDRSAFFTDSNKLREVFCDPERKFPFRAVIKVVRYGAMFGFKVFPPNVEITKADEDNFEYYRRSKSRKNRR